MPQCPAICPPQQCGPTFVKVQQPPRVVCQKKVVYTNRTVIDKHVVPNTKEICEPKLIYQPRTICEPVVVYRKRIINEPKIVYVKRVVQDPQVRARDFLSRVKLNVSLFLQVVCQTRCIVEPKEICQTIVCQPKPQTIQIPPPREFMCAPTGTAYMNRPGCPQVPCLPLGKQCNPCPPKEFNC